MYVLLNFLQSLNGNFNRRNYIPEEGYVADKETAIRIAEAIWLSIYGKKIKQSKPFEVTYIQTLDCWKVKGTSSKDLSVKSVKEIVIKKRHGEISQAGHFSIRGFVPDKETAKKIAVAIWIPIYGKRIYREEPFIVKYIPILRYWIVTGTLPGNIFGGVAEIIIKKSNGKILYVMHGC